MTQIQRLKQNGIFNLSCVGKIYFKIKDKGCLKKENLPPNKQIIPFFQDDFGDEYMLFQVS